MSKSKKVAKTAAVAKKVPAVKGGKAAMQVVDAAKKERPKKEGDKMSGLDAAAKVLGDAGKPMSCKEMVETMLAKGLWQTGGKTPDATIYSSIIREIAAKKEASRFRKADRGKFELATGKEA